MFQLTEEEMENLRSQFATLNTGAPPEHPAEILKRQSGTSSSQAPNLKSQIAISSSHGGRRTLPYAFTEQDVAMLSSVLRSPRAVEVNIAIKQLITADTKSTKELGFHTI